MFALFEKRYRSVPTSYVKQYYLYPFSDNVKEKHGKVYGSRPPYKAKNIPTSVAFERNLVLENNILN